MQSQLNTNFAAIFGDVIRFANNSQQIISDCTEYVAINKPIADAWIEHQSERRITDNMRRIIEDSDIEYEQRVNPDRRMHGAECMAGFCCCGQEE